MVISGPPLWIHPQSSERNSSFSFFKSSFPEKVMDGLNLQDWCLSFLWPTCQPKKTCDDIQDIYGMYMGYLWNMYIYIYMGYIGNIYGICTCIQSNSLCAFKSIIANWMNWDNRPCGVSLHMQPQWGPCFWSVPCPNIFTTTKELIRFSTSKPVLFLWVIYSCPST